MSRDKYNLQQDVHTAKTQIRRHIRAVWSEYSLAAWRTFVSLANRRMYREDCSNQTLLMHRPTGVYCGSCFIL